VSNLIDGLALPISIPREDAALIKICGLQFALLALALGHRLEPCIEHRCRVVLLVLDTATRNFNPKLPGLVLILAKRSEHRRDDVEALQLRRFDRYQLTDPPVAVANSFCLDFVVRKKVSMNMTYTVVDSLPLPRAYSGSEIEREIARRALRLSAVGPEMAEFWNSTAPLLDLSTTNDSPVVDPEQRRVLRAELDVLVARDLFGITRDEMRYLLDPADLSRPVSHAA
jgi:hypothetical protein